MPKLSRKKDVDEVDDFVETLLRAGPFPDPDNHAEAVCNAVLAQINAYKAGIDGDDIDAELMEPELRTAVIIMVHGGRDPASVPYRHVRHALDNPLTLKVLRVRGAWVTENNTTVIPHKMREAINGPLKAIRARCLSCMGGSMDLIRSCPTINCFSWGFRMGSNPMYGRLHGSTGDENEDGFEGADEMAAAEAEFEAEQAERINRKVA